VPALEGIDNRYEDRGVWRSVGADEVLTYGATIRDEGHRAPFYGIELHPPGGSSVGLLTDVHRQVIHQRRRPIPGLYAFGNAAAATEQGVGYQAGLSLASDIFPRQHELGPVYRLRPRLRALAE